MHQKHVTRYGKGSPFCSSLKYSHVHLYSYPLLSGTTHRLSMHHFSLCQGILMTALLLSIPSCQLSCYQKKVFSSVSEVSAICGIRTRSSWRRQHRSNSCWCLTLPPHWWWEWQSCILGTRDSKGMSWCFQGKKAKLGRKWNWNKNTISPSLLYFTLQWCLRTLNSYE